MTRAIFPVFATFCFAADWLYDRSSTTQSFCGFFMADTQTQTATAVQTSSLDDFVNHMQTGTHKYTHAHIETHTHSHTHTLAHACVIFFVV